MPEGPEIRIAADRIARALEGERIVEAYLAPEKLQHFKEQLEGASVTRVDTRGKAMLTRFNNGLTLYSHNQLYGRWFVRERGEFPNTRRSLRLALHTVARSALLYSATDIEIMNATELSAHPFLCRIGPDILDADLDWQTLVSRLDARRFRGRALSSLYLDQSFLAGIGNYLRSEILYFAGLAHARRPAQLSGPECQRLARQTLAVARRSYRTRGLTNTAARIRERSATGNVSRKAHRFAVFDRKDLPCDSCGSPIQRAVAASRRIYFCPHCQV